MIRSRLSDVAILLALGVSFACIACAGEAAAGQGTAAPQTVSTNGPLAALPSSSGAHLEKIKALAPNSWVNLGKPKADPKYGAAQGRSWSRKMAYAPDLRGAFLFGAGSHHGMTMRNGRKYFNDDIYFYDVNAHAWICAHPGTPLTQDGSIDPSITVDPVSKLNIDKDGKIIPVATSVHSYWTPEYDTDRKVFIFMPSTDPFGFLSYDQKTQKYSTPPNYSSPWDGGRYSPYSYDGRTGKFERRVAARGCSAPGCDTGLFYSPKLKRAVYLKNGVWLYDHSTNAWKQVSGEGGVGSAGCYDPGRDQIYTIYRGNGGSNSVAIFDLQSSKWIKPATTGDIGKLLDSNDCFFTFDAANDVALLHVNGKHHAYNPETHAWTAIPSTLSGWINWVSGSGFYDPELKVHFYFNSGDSNTEPGNMWAYRYGSGAVEPAKAAK